MRHFTAVLAALILAGCSSSTETAAKVEPQKAPEPLTGRQAIQSTFPTARGWAPDATLLRARNLNLTGYPSSEGKAVAWEVTYVSPSNGSMRSFNWSAVELGSVHEGVYGGPQQSWTQGRETPIQMTQLGVDTPELFQTAMEEAKDYLKTPGDKPAMTFQIETSERFRGAAVWTVMWGNSAGIAQFAVHLDAKSGELLGKN
jgi:hypothetical protein